MAAGWVAADGKQTKCRSLPAGTGGMGGAGGCLLWMGGFNYSLDNRVFVCLCGDFPQCVKIWFGHEMDLEAEEILNSGLFFFAHSQFAVETDQRVLGGHLYKISPQISAQRGRKGETFQSMFC